MGRFEHFDEFSTPQVKENRSKYAQVVPRDLSQRFIE